MSTWIADRITEASSHQGLMVGGGALLVLFGGFTLMQVVLWGALIWGIWSMLKKG